MNGQVQNNSWIAKDGRIDLSRQTGNYIHAKVVLDALALSGQDAENYIACLVAKLKGEHAPGTPAATSVLSSVAD